MNPFQSGRYSFQSGIKTFQLEWIPSTIENHILDDVVPCVSGLLPAPPLVVLEEGGHLCVSVGGLVSGVRLDPVTNNNGESVSLF